MGDFLLVAYKPIRSSPSADLVIGADGYIVNAVTYDMTSVRNAVTVLYTNAAGQEQSYSATDATSITAYGRRWMQLGEEQTSAIDTSTEATILGDAAIADLKDPTLFAEITVPYLFPVMLNDYLTITADDVFFYTNISYAVAQIQHTFEPGQPATTQLTLTGLPKVLLAPRSVPIIGSDRNATSSSSSPDPLQIVWDGRKETYAAWRRARGY